MKQSPLVAAVARAIRQLRVLAAGDSLVVGVSGGADSTALLDALAGLARTQGFRVVAAHLDHGLRPGSDADAVFCADLAGRLGVPFRTARVDVAARARRRHQGLEEAARRARYAFLRGVMREEGARAIAVAHTRDDQAETVILRLLRGAGSSGLAAMRKRSRDLVRPLLGVSREQVLAYLAERGLRWREDPTNADPDYATRNRVRHEVLPLLARINPNIGATLARTAEVLAGEADLVAEAGRELLAWASRTEGGTLALDTAALAAAPKAAAQAALRAALAATGGRRGVKAVHVERLRALCRPGSSGRSLSLPGGREARVEFGTLRIGPHTESPEPFAISLEVPGQARVPGGPIVRAEEAAGPAASGRHHAVVGLGSDTPLLLRTRRPGDRVYWRGHHVSLKKFLIERRVPVGLRAGLPLVAAGRDVVFVPGLLVGSAPGKHFVSFEVVA
jgi:tRNA(Ile)-lysidine synthase